MIHPKLLNRIDQFGPLDNMHKIRTFAVRNFHVHTDIKF